MIMTMPPLSQQLLDATRQLGRTDPVPEDNLLVEAHNAYIQAVRAERTLADVYSRLTRTAGKHAGPNTKESYGA